MKDKATLLVVDDSPSNLQLLAHVLKEDYFIKVANNGAKALEIARGFPKPDLILLDVIMPEMDGYQVCKELKSDDTLKDIPVIFITGKSESEDEEYGLSIGAADYITKPIRPAIVNVRVKNQITIRRQHKQLQDMAMHDPLTGLYNRYYLIDQFPKRLSRVRRHGHPLSLIMVDIDHFKSINDTRGHKAGDQVIKDVANTLVACSRKEDIVVRFGGEEFLAVLEYCDTDGAMQIAEKMRTQVESIKLDNVSVTASFGIATLSDENQDFESLFKQADEAMYAAKEAGRNRVVCNPK